MKRVPAQQFGQVVGQCVVNQCFDTAVKTQMPFAIFTRMGAVRDVIAQHRIVPACKRAFGFEAVVGGLFAGPNLSTALADFARRDAAHHAAGFGCLQRLGFPASNHRRIQQHDAAHQLRVPCSAHGTQDAAQ